jgi:hypothetical protein
VASSGLRAPLILSKYRDSLWNVRQTAWLETNTEVARDVGMGDVSTQKAAMNQFCAVQLSGLSGVARRNRIEEIFHW